ncbi:prephenate dehydrogenase [Georgenia faecalis]|uniref:Prephenate dehydrogenase n=1 Tax=Georgenia faecalis TaxID=2483799 RepID=A0ABV9DA33_9MICO|nr:prephenate dehydrogenase [Georgenia faecalis]
MTPEDTPGLATTGPVKVVGAGLLGASVGLALSAAGVPVQLEDASPASLALARDMGAGTPATLTDPEPVLVVVATPPDVTADVVLAQLRRHPRAVVTDVASVKRIVVDEVLAAGPDAARYVGSHPMAGRERSGASAADADLFVGRPWVVVETPQSLPAAVLAVRALAVDLGATPVRLGADEHDDAVALVSHLPQLAASLVAARLVTAPDGALALAGQGLRDVTRIAASDPRLWASILAGNAAPVARALREVRGDVDALVAALDRAAEDGPLTPGAMAALADVVGAGNAGAARIPGKHGGAPRRYGYVSVLVPDAPGELGRLFSEVGEAGVNIEDLQLEHSAGARAGLARLAVLPTAVGPLEKALDERGWRVVAE